MSRENVYELAEWLYEDADGIDMESFVEGWLLNLPDDQHEDMLKSYGVEEIDELVDEILSDADGESKVGYIENYLLVISEEKYNQFLKNFQECS